MNNTEYLKEVLDGAWENGYNDALRMVKDHLYDIVQNVIYDQLVDARDRIIDLMMETLDDEKKRRQEDT